MRASEARRRLAWPRRARPHGDLVRARRPAPAPALAAVSVCRANADRVTSSSEREERAEPAPLIAKTTSIRSISGRGPFRRCISMRRKGRRPPSRLCPFPFAEDSSDEEREEPNRRRRGVHGDHDGEAGRCDNGFPGAGLVQGYGCRDRDDEPRRTRYESNEGVVPRERLSSTMNSIAWA
jgi:hypothetical protein